MTPADRATRPVHLPPEHSPMRLSSSRRLLLLVILITACPLLA
jgi:hypothetical protein